jgi:hypothetical protein
MGFHVAMPTFFTIHLLDQKPVQEQQQQQQQHQPKVCKFLDEDDSPICRLDLDVMGKVAAAFDTLSHLSPDLATMKQSHEAEVAHLRSKHSEAKRVFESSLSKQFMERLAQVIIGGGTCTVHTKYADS